MSASGQVRPSMAPPPRGHIQVRSQSLLEVCSNELEIMTMKKTTSLAKVGRASSSIQMTSGKTFQKVYDFNEFIDISSGSQSQHLHKEMNKI